MLEQCRPPSTNVDYQFCTKVLLFNVIDTRVREFSRKSACSTCDVGSLLTLKIKLLNHTKTFIDNNFNQRIPETFWYYYIIRNFHIFFSYGVTICQKYLLERLSPLFWHFDTFIDLLMLFRAGSSFFGENLWSSKIWHRRLHYILSILTARCSLVH